jgi:hypothetical protein
VTNSPIIHRLAATWARAVSLTAALSQPRTDVEAADAAFEALWKESAIARLAGRGAQAFGAAWIDSRARSACGRVAAAIGARGSESAIRATSWMIVVAAATALALDATRPTPVGWYSLVLPGLFAAAGLAAFAAAGALARAWRDRQS